MYVSDVQTNLVGPTQLVLYINTRCVSVCSLSMWRHAYLFFRLFFRVSVDALKKTALKAVSAGEQRVFVNA